MLDRLDLALMRRQLGSLNSGSGAPIAVLEEGSNGRALAAPEVPAGEAPVAEAPAVAEAPVDEAPVAEAPAAAASTAAAPVAEASAPESPAAAAPADRATRWLLSEHGAVRAEAASVREAEAGPDLSPSARETKAVPAESRWAPTESQWAPAERRSSAAERPSAPAAAIATSISLPAAANGAAETQPGPAGRPLPPEVSRWLIADHPATTAQSPAPERSSNGVASWSPDAGSGSSWPTQPASSPSAPVAASAPDDSLGARAKRWSERVRRRGLRR